MASIWTTEDRDAVQEAIRALATGTRKVSVNFSGGGGSRAVTYASADLPALKELLNEINSDLGNTRRTVYAAQRRKGL